MVWSMNQKTIDLRSDTVTRPSPAMINAMVQAELGDDVLGDDPTVQKLEAHIATLMGKPASCFVPSGTMANQLAIRSQTQPGDEIICHQLAHIIRYESGAPAALSGVMIHALQGPLGLFNAEDVLGAIRPRNIHFPKTQLLAIENTCNDGGGSVWPLDLIESVTQAAADAGLRRHLDGARLWNACTALGCKPGDIAQHFDSVSCCFSKGLGAPVGSALCADEQTIARARYFRKMFGGAMRQSGILAAAALYALDHNLDRLSEDHNNAQQFAEILSADSAITLNPSPVQTNIVFFDIDPARTSAEQIVKKAELQGVRTLAVSPSRIRAVWHMDAHDPERAANAIVNAINSTS